MPTTEPSFIDDTTEKVKNNSYFAPTIVAGTGTALAAKGLSDVGNIRNKLDAWENNLAQQRSEMAIEKLQKGSPQLSPEKAQEVMDAYINGARDITHSPVLGMSAGNINKAHLSSQVALARTKEYLKKHLNEGNYTGMFGDLPDLYKDVKHSIKHDPGVEHYRLYSDPDVPLNELRKHHLEGSFDSVGEGSGKLLREINLPENNNYLRNALDEHKFHLGDEADKALRKKVLSNADVLEDTGSVMRMVGNHKGTVLGTARGYRQTVPKILDKILSAKTPILAGGGALTAATAYHAYKKYKQKKEQEALKKSGEIINDDLKDTTREMGYDAAAALGAGAGAGAMYHYAPQLLNPNKEIAVTYGKMSPDFHSWDIGSGHKNPGEALYSLLEKAQDANPEYKDFNLSRIVRNEAGIVDPSQLKDAYNTIADTGLGQFADAHQAGMNAGKRQHPDFFDHTNSRPYQSRAGIMTDMFHPNSRHMSGSTLQNLGPNDHALYYGPESKQIEDIVRGGAKIHKLNETGSPLLLESALESIKDTAPKEEVLSNLAKAHPHLADQLRDAKGKKIITISGSGRGDFVAERALERSKALQEAGRDDVKIIALTGGNGKNPKIQQALANNPHIIPVIGNVDNKTFVGLQRIADEHMGSLGTSSLTENLALPGGRITVPEAWGYDKGYFTPGSIADRWKHRFGDWNPLDTDTWNMGNKEFAKNLPVGAVHVEAHNEKNPLKYITDDKAIAAAKAEAADRAKYVLSDLEKGRSNVVNHIYDIAKENVRKSRIRGGVGALAGAGLTLGSIAAWLKHQKNKREREGN